MGVVSWPSLHCPATGGRSSVGRASGWQPEGQGFESPRLQRSLAAPGAAASARFTGETAGFPRGPPSPKACFSESVRVPRPPCRSRRRMRSEREDEPIVSLPAHSRHTGASLRPLPLLVVTTLRQGGPCVYRAQRGAARPGRQRAWLPERVLRQDGRPGRVEQRVEHRIVVEPDLLQALLVDAREPRGWGG